MGDFCILNLSETERWNQYLEKIRSEDRDIFFTPEYFAIYEKIGDGEAQCFIYEEGDNVALYPFLLNSVNKLGYDLDKEYYDIQGVYGYNGVLANIHSTYFLDSFFACFDEYCIQNNIIAEFLRINPLLNDHLSHRANYSCIFDRENVFLDLSNDNIFETEYEYSTRKNIKKAIKSGLIFKYSLGNSINDSDLDSFSEVYHHTMIRNNVSQYYYFNAEFFKDITRTIGDNALFVFVMLDKQIISCEIVLLGSTIAYSFLGGTLSEYFQYRPNDFLKHNSISFLKEMGFRYYLLGGGPDGVLRYKKSFSKDGVIPFCIGKKIHSKEAYEEVTNQWRERFSEKISAYGGFVLKYRY